MSKPIAIVVEDQDVVRRSLIEWLNENFSNHEVLAFKGVGEFNRWLRVNKEKKVDFSLVDLGLQDGSGIEVIYQLKRNYPKNKNIVITIYEDSPNLFQALQAGADGYILKDKNFFKTKVILRNLITGEPAISPVIARKILTHFHRPMVEDRPVNLTNRERETLSMLGLGLTIPEIAKNLELSSQTVAGYVKNIYRKLQICNRVEAAQEALRLGLI